MEQKQQFVSLAVSGRYTVTELCLEFGISRKTGHKWLRRHGENGMAGLEDRSRAPKSVTGRTADDVERLIVCERRLHPTWGPKKIRWALETKHGLESPPAVSTVGAVLTRHGMVKARRARAGAFNVERGELTVPERCHHVLGVDFKGWFLTGDGERFDPLTVTDLHSRFLMRAEGLPGQTRRWTQKAFRSLFRRQGLPARKGSCLHGRGQDEIFAEGVRTKFLQKMPLLFDGRGCAHQVHYRHTLENLGTEPALVGIIFRKPQNKIPNPSDLKMTAALS